MLALDFKGMERWQYSCGAAHASRLSVPTRAPAAIVHYIVLNRVEQDSGEPFHSPGSAMCVGDEDDVKVVYSPSLGLTAKTRQAERDANTESTSLRKIIWKLRSATDVDGSFETAINVTLSNKGEGLAVMRHARQSLRLRTAGISLRPHAQHPSDFKG